MTVAHRPGRATWLAGGGRGLTGLICNGPAHAVVQGLEPDDGDERRAEQGAVREGDNSKPLRRRYYE